MPYVSDLVNRKVRDAAGNVLGKLQEIAVEPVGEFPALAGILVRTPDDGVRFVPQSRVRELSRLGVTIDAIGADAEPPSGALLIRRELLDRQIIDAAGVRVIRVNDLYFAVVDGVPRLSAVDSSFRGFLRRLGLSGRRSPKIAREVNLLSWSDVEFIPEERASVRLRAPKGRLSRLKPAEIAAIVSQLDARSGARTLEQLDDSVIAETMESIEEEDQADILEQMSPERAADVLEEMPPEEAADALAEVEDARAEEILARMEPEAAEDVRELLAYPGDTAGGLMSPHFISVNVADTVAEALAELRKQRPDDEDIYYVYVLDNEGHLVGVLSLRELVVNEPDTPVAEIMETGVASVKATDDEEAVRELMLRESLLLLPVIDEAGVMVGVVSVTDAVERVVAQSWQHRLRRMLG